MNRYVIFRANHAIGTNYPDAITPDEAVEMLNSYVERTNAEHSQVILETYDRNEAYAEFENLSSSAYIKKGYSSKYEWDIEIFELATETGEWIDDEDGGYFEDYDIDTETAPFLPIRGYEI